MEPTTPGRMVRAALDPVAVRAGFLAGSGGDSGQIIFCGSFDDLGERYPWLPPLTEQRRDVGECTDLIVEVDPDGTIGSVRVEGWDLADMVRQTGRTDDAGAAAAVVGQPVGRALPALAAVVERLFGQDA